MKGQGIAIIVLAVGLAYRAWATDYYVDAAQTDDGADGTNWFTAKKTITNALAQSSPTHVYVKNGTYGIAATISMASGCQLLGGYGGTTPEPGARSDDPASNCIIDAGSICRVFNVTNCAAGTVIDGFTIRNGKAPDYSYAGGLYVYRSTNTISHCRIVSNKTFGSGAYGGGIAIVSSTVSLSNNVIAGNSANKSGSGIWTSSGMTLVNNTIYGNGGQTVGNMLGGIYLNGGASTIKNNIIAGNDCYGIYYVAGTFTLSYNDVWGNTVSNYYGCSPGVGDISRNPILVGGGDYHEQSQAGSWHDGAWTIDANHSPCIDAGDPTSDSSLEPSPNGGQVNMGAYGNTTNASKSLGYIPSSVPRYVRPTAEATPVWPYTNWAMAAGDIQTALNGADGQPVYVKVGTYNITNGHIAMVTAQLLGGYLGTGEPGTRTNSPADACILDAKSLNRVFYCSGCAAGTVIDGFTIRNGNAFVDSANKGGGIHVSGCNMAVTHSRIIGNKGAYCLGGGIYVANSTVAISNNVIAGNDANDSSGYGGGVYTSSGMTLVNNTIYSNSAAATGSKGGGGIYLAGGNSVIKNNIIVTNKNSGINLAGGTATISYNDVWGNTVSNYYNCSAGTGDISTNPCLVGGADYHEQGRGGSWHGGAWTADLLTSPCINAGDPTSDYSPEPIPNGHRINMGAYGGTAQASMAYVRPGTLVVLQ